VPDPIHAVVVDGTVTDVVLMDPGTADEWRAQDMVGQVWPGADLIDVTGTDPQPQIGWTYDGAAFTAPPQPEPDPEQQESSSP
jgi:hypothetical protein